MTAVLAGSDMVILAHTMPGVIQSLVVRPDIKRDEDLKGKTVGVTTFAPVGGRNPYTPGSTRSKLTDVNRTLTAGPPANV